MWKKILIGLAIILIVIQFFRIDKNVPEYDASMSLMSQAKVPQKVAALIQTSCYDCHSYETNYPWYSNIAPVSWFLENDILEGREHLNFSIWESYKKIEKEHALLEGVTLVTKEEMPIKAYLWIHREARLTDQERNTITGWFEEKAQQLQETDDKDQNEEEDENIEHDHSDHEH